MRLEAGVAYRLLEDASTKASCVRGHAPARPGRRPRACFVRGAISVTDDALTADAIAGAIVLVRGSRVLLDQDLARLYGVVGTDACRVGYTWRKGRSNDQNGRGHHR